MSPRALAVPLFALSISANAGAISSFESSLDGWEFIGDVSVQTSAIGLVPTHGDQMVSISTLCDRLNPPAQAGGCETTVREHPFSEVSSPAARAGREFLGLPLLPTDFLDLLPTQPGLAALTGEGGAMRYHFYAPRAAALAFD